MKEFLYIKVRFYLDLYKEVQGKLANSVLCILPYDNPGVTLVDIVRKPEYSFTEFFSLEKQKM